MPPPIRRRLLLLLWHKLSSLCQDTVQECCNANFGPGSHVDETCDYVDVCRQAPPEPEMSMKWDIVEHFGKSGKSSSSGYDDSYGMADDYTGYLHDGSKSGKGASKSGKGGGKSSKGSGSSEHYSEEGYGYGDHSSNDDYDGSHGSSSKSGKTNTDSSSGGGGGYGYTDDYAYGSKGTGDAGKSGKMSGSAGNGGEGSSSTSNEYENGHHGYVPAKGYRLGNTSLRAEVTAMQIAQETKELVKQTGGTNKTLAPTPGFARPSTPFPTEFVTPPVPPGVNTPAPTITTPAPTTCEDQQFWYNGNECTNEEFPSGSFFGYNALIQCCDDKFGPASLEDGTCLYKDICSTVPPSPAPITPVLSPQPMSSVNPYPKPMTMSMHWDVIESFGAYGTSGKGPSSSGYGYSASGGGAESSSKSGKGSSSKSSKSSPGKSGKGRDSSNGYDDEYAGNSDKGSASSVSGHDYGSIDAASGGSSGESSYGEGYSGHYGRRNLRRLY